MQRFLPHPLQSMLMVCVLANVLVRRQKKWILVKRHVVPKQNLNIGCRGCGGIVVANLADPLFFRKHRPHFSPMKHVRLQCLCVGSGARASCYWYCCVCVVLVVVALPQAQALRPSPPHATPMLRADASGVLGGQWQQTWLQQLCCGSNRLVNDAAPRSAKARRANRDHTPGEIVAVTGA